MASTRRHEHGTARGEIEDLVRASAGAVLFGLPLAFTMEMWWLGEHAPAWHIALLVLGGLVSCTLLSRMSGFKHERHVSWPLAVSEAIEAVALGCVVGAIILVAIGQLNSETGAAAAMGMILFQGATLGVGACVAQAVFGHGGRVGSSSDSDGHDTKALLRDLGATAAGALFLSAALAPTEEIPMISAALPGWHVLPLVIISLTIGYLIVHASGFDSARQSSPGFFRGPFSETTLSYAVALVCGAVILVGFGQIHVGDPPGVMLVEIFVLGLPASIGGAAGRIVV